MRFHGNDPRSQIDVFLPNRASYRACCCINFVGCAVGICDFDVETGSAKRLKEKIPTSGGTVLGRDHPGESVIWRVPCAICAGDLDFYRRAAKSLQLDVPVGSAIRGELALRT